MFLLPGKIRARNDIGHALSGIAAVSNRPQTARSAPKKEARPRRTRATYGVVGGDAVEDRAGLAIPDLADAAADCNGLQRRPRILFRAGGGWTSSPSDSKER